MSGNSIGFGEEIKKLCQKMCSLCMLIWSAGSGTNISVHLKKQMVVATEETKTCKKHSCHA